MPQHAVSTSFKPGQSGNPGGMPKLTAEVRRMAVECAAKVFPVAQQIALDPDANERARVAAIRLVMEYAVPKPAQALELSGPEGGPLLLATPQIAETREQWEARVIKAQRRLLDGPSHSE